jgi:hypothetical protein
VSFHEALEGNRLHNRPSPLPLPSPLHALPADVRRPTGAPALVYLRTRLLVGAAHFQSTLACPPGVSGLDGGLGDEVGLSAPRGARGLLTGLGLKRGSIVRGRIALFIFGFVLGLLWSCFANQPLTFDFGGVLIRNSFCYSWRAGFARFVLGFPTSASRRAHCDPMICTAWQKSAAIEPTQ